MFNTSRAINLSEEYVELFDTSFDYENWLGEPSCYYCIDGESCTGKLETAHGYCLACMRCSEEEGTGV